MFLHALIPTTLLACSFGIPLYGVYCSSGPAVESVNLSQPETIFVVGEASPPYPLPVGRPLNLVARSLAETFRILMVNSHPLFSSTHNMLRRKPTRINLTPDDVVDYDALKRKTEELKRVVEAERKPEEKTERERRQLEREARIGIVRRNNHKSSSEGIFGQGRQGGV